MEEWSVTRPAPIESPNTVRHELFAALLPGSTGFVPRSAPPAASNFQNLLLGILAALILQQHAGGAAAGVIGVYEGPCRAQGKHAIESVLEDLDAGRALADLASDHAGGDGRFQLVYAR